MRPDLHTVTLEYDGPEKRLDAAQFIAELVRQGVGFKAAEDIGPNIARTDSIRVLVITFTGAF